MITDAADMIKSLNGQYIGIVLWEGKSFFDGSPIACIATGINKKSSNPKTGSMVQTWIIRTDMHPVEAVKSGRDDAICGTCPYKSGGPCYVKQWQAPAAVYRAYHANRYIKPHQYDASILPEVFRDHMVRIGSYGDAGAMPNIWAPILRHVRGFTGYTHAWATRPDLMLICMASVDASDYDAAKQRGWRTFRVRTDDNDRKANEVNCGASREAGKVTTCAECRMCSGLWHKSSRDIAITDHAAGYKGRVKIAA